jgi:hypothetical protein
VRPVRSVMRGLSFAVTAAMLISAAVRADAPLAQYAEVTQSSLTVHDVRTQLEWERQSACGDGSGGGAPSCTWAAALAHCSSLNANTYAGHADWRLPSIKELQTVVDRRYTTSYNQMRIDPKFQSPPGTIKDGQTYAPFWSSTPMAGSSSLAWVIDFAKGVTTRVAYTGTGAVSGYARCVRSRAAP